MRMIDNKTLWCVAGVGGSFICISSGAGKGSEWSTLVCAAGTQILSGARNVFLMSTHDANDECWRARKRYRPDRPRKKMQMQVGVYSNAMVPPNNAARERICMRMGDKHEEIRHEEQESREAK